eukprot:NODE_147_length_17537_cov_0.265627.p3 type:complete len:320 gc:universal NODE_147_length_17537_cov_0.265627:10380-11339(+)
MKEHNLNFLELFSGIGGLRLGFKKYIKSCVSFDMNENANSVYRSNFDEIPNNSSINCLTVNNLAGFDVWLLSPNCQPFTLGGKNLDDKDQRTLPFLNVISQLQVMKERDIPKRIFIENSPGFYRSKTYLTLTRTLLSREFTIQPIFISPDDIGIPNRRKRCYILAWRSVSDERTLLQGRLNDAVYSIPTLRAFLGDTESGAVVPIEKMLKFPKYRFDIVSLDCNHTSTFTKSYGRNLIGSGSLLGDRCTFLCGNDCSIDSAVKYQPLFLSVAQLLKLSGFPDNFKMESLTTTQKYALIGNSVNVYVISYLADYLMSCSR